MACQDMSNGSLPISAAHFIDVQLCQYLARNNHIATMQFFTHCMIFTHVTPTDAIRGHDKLLGVQVDNNPIAEIKEAARSALFAMIERASLYGKLINVEPADPQKLNPSRFGAGR